MPKNKITDLRNHLFTELERLSDPKEKEPNLDRAKAICNVAGKIIETAKVEVKLLEATGSLPTNDFFDVDSLAIRVETRLGTDIRGKLTNGKQ